MVVWNRRAAIEAKAMVTPRITPLVVNGKTLHQIGLPFHWGYSGETPGAMANDLTSIVTDPNVSMHEAKAFTVNICAGRLPRPQATDHMKPAPWPEHGPTPDTKKSDQPEGQML